MLTDERANELAQDWLDAWNRHDLEAILSHYDPEVVFTSPFVIRLTGDATGMLRGKEALRAYFSTALAAYPDLRFELFHILVGVDSLVIHYRSVNALLAAERMVVNAEGKVSSVQCHYCSEPKS